MKNVSWLLLIVSLLLVLHSSLQSTEVFWAGLSIITSLSLFCYALGALSKRYFFFDVVGALPLGLLLYFTILQLVPMPPVLVEALSPHTYQLYQPLLDEQESQRWISLSTSPKKTLQLFFLLSSSILIYILSQQLFSDRIKVKTYIFRAFLSFTLLSLITLGLLPLIAGLEVWGLLSFLYFLVPVIFALFLYYIPVIKGRGTLGDELRLLLKEPDFQTHLIYLSCFVLLVVVLIVQSTWTALLCLYGIALLFLLFFSLKFTATFRPVLLLLLLIVLPFFAGLFPANTWYSKVWHNINGTHLFEVTGELATILIQIIKRFPLFGAGFGSSEEIIPYLFADLEGAGVVARLPLGVQLIIEIGLIGVVLIFWFFLSLSLAIWKMVRVRNDRFVSLMGIGAMTALTGFMLQLLFLPDSLKATTLIYFAWFIGVCNSAVHCRFHYYEPDSYRAQKNRTFSLLIGCFSFMLCGFSILTFSTNWYAGYLSTNVGFAVDGEDLTSKQLKAARDSLRIAMALDPLESRYPYKLAQLESFADNDQRARDLFVDAGIRNVMHGSVYQQLALRGERRDEERVALIEVGFRHDPGNTELGLQYGAWLFSRNKREEALHLIERAVALEPEEALVWLPLLMRNEVTPDELLQILPHSVELWLQLADESEKEGKLLFADFFYQQALAISGGDEYVDPAWLQQIIGYYKKRGRKDMELLAIRRAISVLPVEPVFHRLLGDYYRREGVRYRAIEEYREVLKINPEDPTSKSELQDLLDTE